MSKRILIKNTNKENKQLDSSSYSQNKGDSSSRSTQSAHGSGERISTTKIEIEFKGQNRQPSSRQFNNRFYGCTNSNFSYSPQIKSIDIRKLNKNNWIENRSASKEQNTCQN